MEKLKNRYLIELHVEKEKESFALRTSLQNANPTLMMIQCLKRAYMELCVYEPDVYIIVHKWPEIFKSLIIYIKETLSDWTTCRSMWEREFCFTYKFKKCEPHSDEDSVPETRVSFWYGTVCLRTRCIYNHSIQMTWDLQVLYYIKWLLPPVRHTQSLIRPWNRKSCRNPLQSLSFRKRGNCHARPGRLVSTQT